MHIAHSLIDLVGSTPLVWLSRITHKQIAAKIESRNPGGSLKDRIALSMIEEAEQQGLIDQRTTIIEPTSGNTGIALAWIAAIKGYRLILTMPEEMTPERRKLLEALGATVILTDAQQGMEGAIKKARSLAKKIGNAFIPMQFENPANPGAHARTTAQEIWNDTEGMVNVVVAGVGTGGTVTGIGKTLKNLKPDIKIIAVEPASSAVLSGGQPGKHQIQGIGAGFVPPIFDRTVVDEIIQVDDAAAFHMMQKLMRFEGIICGPSSGAVVHAALAYAQGNEDTKSLVVAILPDTGERYLSMLIGDPPEW